MVWCLPGEVCFVTIGKNHHGLLTAYYTAWYPVLGPQEEIFIYFQGGYNDCQHNTQMWFQIHSLG